MGEVSFEKAPELSAVCKFFHKFVVPKMRYPSKSTPEALRGALSNDSPFAKVYAPCVVALNLQWGCNFKNGHLKLLTNMQNLDLSFNDKISDASLSGLTNLTWLSLSDKKRIIDDALSRFVKLKKLKLNSNTKITNDALSHLLELTDLNLTFAPSSRMMRLCVCQSSKACLLRVILMSRRMLSNVLQKSRLYFFQVSTT